MRRGRHVDRTAKVRDGNDVNGPSYSAKASGDGYELLDPDGNVIAWTFDQQWAWRIIVALEAETLRQLIDPHEFPL